MLRLRAASMLVMLLGALLVAPGHATAAAAGSPRVMVVGDSITQGSAGDYTWRYRLYQHLRAGGATPDFVGPRNDLYDNVAGRQGDTRYADPAFDTDHDAIWGRQIAQAETVAEAEVRAANPDYLLVLLGINDLTFSTDAPQTEVLLRRFVEHARAGHPGVRIVLGTVLPTSKSVAEPDFATRLADYNTRLAKAAAELNTPAAPIEVAQTSAAVDVAADLYDGVHPNARGELRIAAAFADALSRRFAVGGPYPRPLPDVPTGPLTPPVLTGVPTDQGVRLSWTESPGATGYWVWMRKAGAPDFERLPWPLQLDASPWPAGGLVNGTVYEFRLQPAKYYNPGVFSNTVAVTAGSLLPPSDLRVEAGDRAAILRWTAVGGATGYYVQMRDVTAGETGFTSLPWPVQAPEWTAGGLFAGGTYEFRLQSATMSGRGDPSAAVRVTVGGRTPAAATELTVANGDGAATLSWRDAADATGYYVQMRNVSAGESTFTQLPWAVFGGSWTAGLLTNGATYEFRLVSANGYLLGGTTPAVTARPAAR